VNLVAAEIQKSIAEALLLRNLLRAGDLKR
jgi:hypothetical protein